MSGAAQSAMIGASAATPEFVGLRSSGSAVIAGAYASVQRHILTPWHVHDLHQIAYAAEGVVQVETRAARYLLPPQQAVWIPAGLPHKTTLKHVRDISLFFDPSLIPGVADRVRVIEVEPVFREMIIYSTRWPIDRPSSDHLGLAYFSALAALVAEWLDQELPYQLPTSADPCIALAMRFTDEHLASVTLQEVCSMVALSERSLRRRFVSETGLTWREYLLRSRLMRSMALLSESNSTIAVIASKVGFSNASAFARAFAGFTGQSPSDYRSRS